MRALVLQGPNELAVEQRPRPLRSDDDVLIDVIATGICGSDLHGYTGKNGRRFAGQVMGHETVGRVVERGKSASEAGFQIDDLVALNPVLKCGVCDVCLAPPSDRLCPRRRVIGVDPAIVSAFAEQMAVPHGNLVLLPPGMRDPLVGALVEPLAVGYRAARRGGAGPGEKVVVIGAGPIGQAAALGARRLGAEVIVKEIAVSRAEKARSLGFPLDSDGAILAGWGGADVVIDAVGIDATLRDALTASRPGGRVVLVGMGAPEVSLDAYRISTEEREIIGSFCYSDKEFRATAAWAADNEVMLSDLIDEIVPLDEAAVAFSNLAQGRSEASKILVTFEDSAHE